MQNARSLIQQVGFLGKPCTLEMLYVLHVSQIPFEWKCMPLSVETLHCALNVHLDSFFTWFLQVTDWHASCWPYMGPPMLMIGEQSKTAEFEIFMVQRSKSYYCVKVKVMNLVTPKRRLPVHHKDPQRAACMSLCSYIKRLWIPVSALGARGTESVSFGRQDNILLWTRRVRWSFSMLPLVGHLCLSSAAPLYSH